MKKLLVLIISLFLASIALAHGGSGWRNDSRSWRNDKGMDQHHNLMHDSQVKAEKTDKGIKIEMTAQSKEVRELIQKEFLENQKNIESYFDGVKVTAKKLDSGVELTLSSDDTKTVEQLQYQGDGLVYQYLRDNIHGSRAGRSGYQRHHGRSGGCGFGSGSEGQKWQSGPVS
jgi:hypothetical protein